MQSRVGGSEQMAGVDELDLHTMHDRDGPLVSDRLQSSQRPRRIEGRVERKRRRVFCVALSVCPSRVFFLNLRRVREDEGAEISRARRTEDAALEALRDESWQIAAVIEMRMCQHDRVDLRRVDWERRPVSESQLLQSLEQTAVDQYAVVTEIEQVLRSGDSPRCAEKRERRHRLTILAGATEPESETQRWATETQSHGEFVSHKNRSLWLCGSVANSSWCLSCSLCLCWHSRSS